MPSNSSSSAPPEGFPDLVHCRRGPGSSRRGRPLFLDADPATMTFFRTVEPAFEPVTLSEIRAWPRLDHASEDTMLEGLVRAAREEVELRTGLALITQSWRVCIDKWPRTGTLRLPRSPAITIDAVTRYGRDGDATQLDPADFVLNGRTEPASIALRPGMVVPVGPNGIEVDFTAGFGPSGPDVPDALKHAIKVLVAHWFEFRGAFGPADQPVSFPDGFERLLRAHRRVGLA